MCNSKEAKLAIVQPMYSISDPAVWGLCWYNINLFVVIIIVIIVVITSIIIINIIYYYYYYYYYYY